MMTDRPYRAALGEAESLRQLYSGRGSQFDPELLDIFVGLVEQGLLVVEHMNSVGSEGEL
jgi:HD-GYP domain-containing protein (c-di-GMP phosphodiesterase class II)